MPNNKGIAAGTAANVKAGNNKNTPVIMAIKAYFFTFIKSVLVNGKSYQLIRTGKFSKEVLLF
jgi:hypothetical protein